MEKIFICGTEFEVFFILGKNSVALKFSILQKKRTRLTVKPHWQFWRHYLKFACDPEHPAHFRFVSEN